MQVNGFNPMRHDCERQGCFNTIRRPKIELFAECFPRKIAMADVDGVVEINQRFLFLEWKTPFAQLSSGGKRTLCAFSMIEGSISIAAWGDAKEMSVIELSLWVKGNRYDCPEPNMEVLKLWMKTWAILADKKQEFLAYDITHGITEIVF